MNLNIPIYDIELNEDDIGLVGVSFVDYPAIQRDFIAFNDKEIRVYFSSEEKKEVVSPILIPDQLLYRESQGRPYYIRWKADMIAKVAERFILNGFFNNVSLQHEWFNAYDTDKKYEDTLLKDVSTLRVWITEDENDDLYTLYGYKVEDVPLGSLAIHYKVCNAELWAKIKSGEVKGLSIEGFIHQKLAQNNKLDMKKLDFDKKKLSLLEKLVCFLNEVSEEAAQIEEVVATDETESGKVSVKYYTSDDDYIEVDPEGYATGGDGQAVKGGEYMLNDGNILVIDEDGKFVETKKAEETSVEEPIEAPIAEEEQKPTEEEEKEEEQCNEEVLPTAEETEQQMAEVEINGEVFKVDQAVADYIATLEEKVNEKEEEVLQLKAVTPSAKPVGNVVKEGNMQASGLAGAIARLNKR